MSRHNYMRQERRKGMFAMKHTKPKLSKRDHLNKFGGAFGKQPDRPLGRKSHRGTGKRDTGREDE